MVMKTKLKCTGLYAYLKCPKVSAMKKKHSDMK
jgi:hypothetical protein